MPVQRFFLLSVISISIAARGFAADIVLSPESPERGKKLTLSLNVADATDLNWVIERKTEEGKIEDVQPADGTNGAKEISELKAGEYFISVGYQLAGAPDKARGHFVVNSVKEETSQAADAKLSSSKVTQESVLGYLAVKIHGDTNSIQTAILLGQKLKTILENNKDVESKEIIYKEMRAGVEAVIDTRLEDSLKLVDKETAVGQLQIRLLKQGFADWTDANEHLIKRLEETTKDASELRLTLNDAVLPALGAESIPLKDRTPETPVPPLNNDTLLRILQANQRTNTVPQRRKKCCLGILLGL
jgi:hypothetical protein